MITRVTILALLFAGLINCSRKPVYTCGLGYLSSRPPIESRILKLERVAITDTTIAFISGIVLGHDSSETATRTDTLMFANVFVVDKKTGKTIGNATDLKGHYQFYLPASTYDLKVQFIAYNTLIIQNAFFGTGDIVEFNALLGQSGAGRDSCVFQMQPDRTIKEIYKPAIGIKK